MTATQTQATATETVAVLGAGGTMGFPIARNLARAGIPVRAWNRSRDKAEPLATDGASVADTPRDAADGAAIVITMLADEDAIITAMNGPDGALSAMSGANQAEGYRAGDPNGPQHAIWVQMSTIGEADRPGVRSRGGQAPHSPGVRRDRAADDPGRRGRREDPRRRGFQRNLPGQRPEPLAERRGGLMPKTNKSGKPVSRGDRPQAEVAARKHFRFGTDSGVSSRLRDR
jgi:hypothetical protein